MTMTEFKDFQGAAKRLDDIDLPLLGYRIGVGEDEVHAFMEVEAANSGFDRHGRPAMLFEPHVFYRQLGPGPKRDRAVAAGLAYAKWKRDYPSDSYPRLKEAMLIDETAALKSASWGIGQILGSNYEAAGFETPQAMVLAFMEDEEAHIESMILFLVNEGIADDLRAHRWATVARVYNGPSYAVHGYHTRLEAAYRKWAGIPDTPWQPDRAEQQPVNGEELKAVQRQLRSLGYTEVGVPDGKWGTRTRAAVLAFRADRGLPIYVGIDDELLAEMLRSAPREVAPERRTATTEDLRRSGSKTIEATDKANGAAVVVGGAGAIGAAVQGIEALGGQLEAAQGVLAMLEPLKDSLIAAGPWVMMGVAGFVVYQMVLAQKARLDDHRSGKNAGPDAHAKIEVAR